MKIIIRLLLLQFIAFAYSCEKEKIVLTEDAEVYVNPIIDKRENHILLSADSNLYLLNRYSKTRKLLKSNIGNLKKMKWHPSRNKFACINYEKDSIFVIDRNGIIESMHPRQGINSLIWNQSGSSLLGLTGNDINIKTVIGSNTFQPSVFGMNKLHSFYFIDDNSYAMSYQSISPFTSQHIFIKWQGEVTMSHSAYYLQFEEMEFFENRSSLFCKSNSQVGLFDPTQTYSLIPSVTTLTQFTNLEYSLDRNEYLATAQYGNSYSLIVCRRNLDNIYDFDITHILYESESEIYDYLW